MTAIKLSYDSLTISGKIGVGSTTLSRSLEELLNWKYINVGQIQRQYDQEQGINENLQGAMSRSDEHEKEIDDMALKVLQNEKQVIFEAWLAGFLTRDMKHVLKVLLVCSNEAVRIDRVVNRENTNIETAKRYIKQREEENVTKWQKLYGNHDFWSQEYYDLVIDTYGSGPMETTGIVLDKLGYKNVKKT